MQKIRHLIPFWVELEAHPRYIPWLRQFVPAYFKGVGVTISSRDCMKVMLALVEAFDNVMEHAYPRARHKPVLIGFHLRGKRLQVDVMDKGRGIPKGRHDLPSATKESGRGLYLIYRLAKQVQTQREDGWHRLRMTIPLGK